MEQAKEIFKRKPGGYMVAGTIPQIGRFPFFIRFIVNNLEVADLTKKDRWN